MAQYKVPQDVEADDKLIGPFSFRQFIYLIIVALAGGAAYGLSTLFIGLAIIPLPIIVFFGALALPLRKDQPMETYLAAIVSFYLKPHKRLWDPDGIQSLIEITAPKTVEVQRTKGFDQNEAERRLSYLANVVDSRGWAVRGVSGPSVPNSAMNPDVYYDAQQTEDVLGDDSRTAQMINTRLDESAARMHEEALQRMRQPAPVAQAPVAAVTPPVVTGYTQPVSMPTAPQPADDTNMPHPDFNPYPAMHQSVIQPTSEQATPAPMPAATPEPKPTADTPSKKQTSPDIINLANNSGLSVETIAREARRIQQKQQLSEDEVVISLR